MGVSVIIKNTGTSELTNLDWSIALDGGFVKKTKHQAPSFSSQQVPQQRRNFQSLDSGKPITVIVNGSPMTKQGFVFLFFVLGVK